jgi:hypothetical protein
MKSIHPVFHVLQLEPSVPNTIPNHVQPLPPLVEVDGEPEFEITEILNSKIDHQRQSCQLLYLVHCVGYEGTDEVTLWLLATELGHTLVLVLDYHLHYPGKSSPHVTT